MMLNPESKDLKAQLKVTYGKQIIQKVLNSEVQCLQLFIQAQFLHERKRDVKDIVVSLMVTIIDSAFRTV